MIKITAWTNSETENVTFLKQAKKTEVFFPLDWLCCEKPTSLCGVSPCFLLALSYVMWIKKDSENIHLRYPVSLITVEEDPLGL